MRLVSTLNDPRVKKFKEDGRIVEFLKSLKSEDNIYIRDYQVVALSDEEHEKHPTRVILEPNMLSHVQDSCLDCIRKHIGRAYKKLEETVNGHTNNSLRAQIELEEAEEEAKDKYPELAEAIRQVRKSLWI